MPRDFRTRSILARAAAHSLYAAKEKEDPGAGGGGSEPEKVELTQDELDAKLEEARTEAREAAVKEEREKRKQAEKDKRKRERQAAGEDEEEEDPTEVAKAAELRAAEAEQRAAEAEKKALMADVGVRLRDYLQTNFKEFVGNAPDIILHIERALPKDATEQAIVRLIEAQSKAFVERTKSAKAANPAPSITRSKISNLPQERDTRQITRQPEERPFAAMNWNG